MYCSPLKRAIETTAISFKPLIEMTGLRVTVLEELKSYGSGPNGLAATAEELQGEYDWLEVDEMGRKRLKPKKRVAFFEKFLMDQQSEIEGLTEIFLVTHSSILRDIVPDCRYYW